MKEEAKMDDDSAVRKFEKLKPYLNKYIKSMINMVEALTSNVTFIDDWLLFFKRNPDRTRVLLPEEIESFLRMEKELPDLARELRNIREFLGQYKENFEILPGFEARFRRTSRRIQTFLILITKFHREIRGEVKWH
jgi:hypothetical protein